MKEDFSHVCIYNHEFNVNQRQTRHFRMKSRQHVQSGFLGLKKKKNLVELLITAAACCNGSLKYMHLSQFA